jgi:hypothetical protein
MQATTEKLIETYIKIRDTRDARAKEHSAEIKNFNDQLDVLQEELLTRCEEAGGNITTPVGNVRRRISSMYWTSDWPAFYQMMKEHDAFHLLHQRISNKAVQEFLEANPNLVPPGLNADSKYVVTVVRK